MYAEGTLKLGDSYGRLLEKELAMTVIDEDHMIALTPEERDLAAKIEFNATALLDREYAERIENGESSLKLVRMLAARGAKDPTALGEVHVFHTNGWGGTRLTKNHWQGDLPQAEAARALAHVRRTLADERGCDLVNDTKILMLTHRALANEIGYGSMHDVFRYDDS